MVERYEESLDRQNTLDELVGLQNEIEMGKKIDRLIDQNFSQFKVDLLTDTRADYNLRKERNLSMEKMKDGKLKIKSYGETSELDLKTGRIYYYKWWESVEVLSLDKLILTFSPGNFKLESSELYSAFWKMNVINRAMSMAKTTDKKDFYFRPGGFRGKWHGGVLMVDGKEVMTFNWIKKWFGNNITKEQFKDMLNKVVL